MELNRVFPIGLVIVCTPLSLLLLILWFPYAGSVWFGSFELSDMEVVFPNDVITIVPCSAIRR